MKRLLVLALLAGCDSGDSGGGDARLSDATLDAARDDASPDAAPSDAAELDAAELDAAEPDAAEPDMAEPDAGRRRPVAADEPRAQACPATPRAPQVELLAASGDLAGAYDGPVSVAGTQIDVVTFASGAGELSLRMPLVTLPHFRPGATFTAHLRRRSMGFTEGLLVLRNAQNQIVFAAAIGTSWVTTQFADRAAVGESFALAGACAEVGDRCFDRVDREVIFAGGNRRRALLPGTSSDFTTDGGSFQLHVDQAYQVACEVLCPNVANQWFSFWMLRDGLMAEPLDADGDGVLDSMDVCPLVADPDQTDRDRDGEGDACDPQDNGSPFFCGFDLECPSRICRPDGRCEEGSYVVPGAPEVCDGFDNDGNGEADDGLAGCGPAQFCTFNVRVEAAAPLMRGAGGTLTVDISPGAGGCQGVEIREIAWDLGADGRIEETGTTLMLRTLRSQAPVLGVVRFTDSRGGITEVPFRLPVATSEFCP